MTFEIGDLLCAVGEYSDYGYMMVTKVSIGLIRAWSFDLNREFTWTVPEDLLKLICKGK